MAAPLPIGKTVRIRDCGYDEVWLQDQIVANPSCLGLGDLGVMCTLAMQAGKLLVRPDIPLLHERNIRACELPARREHVGP